MRPATSDSRASDECCGTEQDAFLHMSNMLARRQLEVWHRRAPPLSAVIGPCLVVYIMNEAKRPSKHLEEVKSMFWSAPGVADTFRSSSWGRTTVDSTDVDFFELPTIAVPSCLWSNLSTYADIAAEPEFQHIFARRPYRRVLLILPGRSHAASAEMSGTVSSFCGDAVHWATVVHELAHNLGAAHAGGLSAASAFHRYQDDAISMPPTTTLLARLRQCRVCSRPAAGVSQWAISASNAHPTSMLLPDTI